MGNRKKKQSGLVMNIILSLICLAALTFSVFLLLTNYQLKNDLYEEVKSHESYVEEHKDYLYTEAQVLNMINEASADSEEKGKKSVTDFVKDHFSEGKTTASLLRELYPEFIVVNVEGGYQFFDILDSLKKNDYDLTCFTENGNGYIEYNDAEGHIVSKMGIDVSKHQELIDWKKVKESGVDFAFIRCGYRGNTEGKLVEDEYFKRNIEGALKNNIEVGVYFYTMARDEQEAKEEAQFVLDLIEPYDVTYPVVYDIEKSETNKPRTQGLTKEQYTKNTLIFLDTIKKSGYAPMVYGNLYTYMIMLNMEELEEYDKWFAYYQSPVYFPYAYSVWQYSSSGVIDGIKGDVDLNICLKEY